MRLVYVLNCKEFSSENLLCILELMKFRKRYVSEPDGVVIVFPPRIESIESDIMRQEGMECQAVLLIEKYLLNNAEFCVNISHSLRMEMQGLREHLKDAGGTGCDGKVFDEVIAAVLRVMNDSFTRFRITDDYKGLTQ